MWRSIGGVILGYLVMAVVVMTTFTVMYLLLGTSGSYAEGSYEPSTMWNAMSLVLSFIAAIAGGFACALVSKNRVAPKVLAGIILVLGLLMAIPGFLERNEPLEPRPDDVSMTDAMQKSKSPLWVTVVTPLVGVAGVVFGASFRKQQP